MKKIKLTQGKYAIVDDEDYENLNQYNWCFNAGYAVRSNYVNGKQIGLLMMHREIMKTPKNMSTDHINHNKLDNRKSNLRIVTQAQNSYNRLGKKKGTSKYKGVSWHKDYKKWSVVFDKKWVGSFSDEVEAAKAYDKAAKEKFGEYALLNFS